MIKEPPYKIDICWEYDRIFKSHPQKKNIVAFWKPKLKNEEHKNECKEDNNCYILGFLGLTHELNPNDNIPSIIVKLGTDNTAFKLPEEFSINKYEKRKKRTPNGKELNIHRYWLELIPFHGYTALGSIVIEKNEEIPNEIIINKQIKNYLKSTKIWKIYNLDYVVCLKTKYCQGPFPCISQILKSKEINVWRPQPMAVSGVHKLVEMPFMIESMIDKEKETNDDDDVGVFLSTGFRIEWLEYAVRHFSNSIAVISEAPLIISKATSFILKWSSIGVTSTSNTKCAVWEPVLGIMCFCIMCVLV